MEWKDKDKDKDLFIGQQELVVGYSKAHKLSLEIRQSKSVEVLYLKLN